MQKLLKTQKNFQYKSQYDVREGKQTVTQSEGMSG